MKKPTGPITFAPSRDVGLGLALLLACALAALLVFAVVLR